jgi:hypothetical protein
VTPHIAVISSGRPGAPAKMARFLEGLDVTWYVGPDERDDYERFVVGYIVEGLGLIEARNRALDDAFDHGWPCLQLSDDLTKLQMIEASGQTVECSLQRAIDTMSNATAMTGAKLAGVAPTSNAFFGKREINPRGFCVGDMILVQPTDLRFDSRFRLKEDYDYTAQHLDRYGKVARVDWILASFTHRTNPGGAVAVRTPEVEQEAIAILKEKWPAAIRDNAKRPDEILFRWPAGESNWNVDLEALEFAP